MGIKGLKKLIKKKIPGIIETIPLAELTAHTVAVDISVYLYTFVKSVGEPRWIDRMIMLLCTLRKHRIRAVCIFDGPNAPIEKSMEREKRKKNFAEQADKLSDVSSLKTLIDVNYGMYGKPIPKKLHEQIRTVLGRSRIRRENDGLNYECAITIMKALEKRELSLEKQTTPVDSARHSAMVKEFLDTIGIPYIQADGEAETLCSYLARHGKVDAVLSTDTDVLVYGTPLWFSDIDTNNETVTAIRFNNVLDGLQMDLQMFRDLAIMCRCDYNKHEDKVTVLGKNGRPKPVGPQTAFDLIIKYGSFEAIEAKVGSIDLRPLNWKRCRELFQVPTTLKSNIVPYVKKVIPEQLYLFLKKYDCTIDQDFIEELWRPTPFVFE